MGRVGSPLQQPGIVQHGGGGADSGEGFAIGCLLLQDLEEGRGIAEGMDAGSARQHHQIEGFIGNGGEMTVCLQGDTIAARDLEPAGLGSYGAFHPASPEDVQGRDGLQFLQSIGKDE